MQKPDRFLIGILVGIALILIAAFAVTLLRPKPAYKPDDTPENIVHNYLLAVENQDYARAYTYLSPSLDGYPPDMQVFIEDIERNSWVFRRDVDHALSVTGSRSISEVIVVSISVTWYYNEPFAGQPSTETFTLRVQAEGNSWKIISGEQFFWPCWSKLEEYCR